MSRFRNLPSDYKPREKMSMYGSAKLSEVELLAILLQNGYKNDSVLVLAQKLLEKHGGLDEVLNLSKTHLEQMHGIGMAKSSIILAVNEIRKRNLKPIESNKIQINHPSNIYEIFKSLSNEIQEYMYVCCLDNKGVLIAKRNVYIGTVNEISIHPREIFNFAIEHMSSSIIIVHNHPSGDPTPSNADIESTKRLIKISKIVGIEIIDHLVIGNNQFVSLREKYGIMF